MTVHVRGHSSWLFMSEGIVHDRYCSSLAVDYFGEEWPVISCNMRWKSMNSTHSPFLMYLYTTSSLAVFIFCLLCVWPTLTKWDQSAVSDVMPMGSAVNELLDLHSTKVKCWMPLAAISTLEWLFWRWGEQKVEKGSRLLKSKSFS